MVDHITRIPAAVVPDRAERTVEELFGILARRYTRPVREKGVKCFMIEDTGRARVFLRRYVGEGKCESTRVGYHNVQKLVGVHPNPKGEDGCWHGVPAEQLGVVDADWPTACECGYQFTDEDVRQVFCDQLYAGTHPEQGPIETTLDDAPAGAIWRASWYEQHTDYTGPDGLALVCMLPGNHPWHIDGPAMDGGRWTRTGTPPALTVRPSILVNNPPPYHGFLTDGELVAC